VSESVFEGESFAFIGDISVINHGSGGNNRNSDFLPLDSMTHLFVSKDIGVMSGSGGTAVISMVENSFTPFPSRQAWACWVWRGGGCWPGDGDCSRRRHSLFRFDNSREQA
jgi:hypothetical protein